MRHIGVVFGVVALLVIYALAATPVTENASATTYYYAAHEISSYNSTSWKVFPRYSTGETAMYAAQVREDGYATDLYTSATITYVQTNDFKNPTWNEPTNPYVGGQLVDPPIPDNGTATIEKIYVVVQFSLNIPECYLSYSIDDQGTWEQSSLYSASTNQRIYWDVTTLETWNATMINSNETWVQLKAYTTSGIHYYLDYLGLSVTWSADYALDPEYGVPVEDPPEDPAEETGGANLTYDIIYSAEGLIGVLGFIGFVGMIGIPAFAVWYFRNSDEGKMSVFIKMLCLFMICLAFFMTAVSGS